MTADESISRIADRLEIIELTARYAFLADNRNLDEFMDLWSDDDPVFDEENVGLKKVVGKKAIRDYVETIHGGLDAVCHLVTNHIVENISADTATGSHTVHVKGDVTGGSSCETTAYYEDRYVRQGGRWKFASRKVTGLTKTVFGDYELPELEQK
jgi:ketosteroid isomerase-like protein